jgi:hypothetical protein
MSLAKRTFTTLLQASRASASRGSTCLSFPTSSRAAPVLVSRNFGGTALGHVKWMSSTSDQDVNKETGGQAEQKPSQGTEGADAKKQEGTGGQEATKGASDSAVFQTQLKEKTDLLKKKDDEIKDLKNQCEAISLLLCPCMECLECHAWYLYVWMYQAF